MTERGGVFCHGERGEHGEEIICAERSLSMFFMFFMANILGRDGFCHGERGEHGEAIICAERSLSMFCMFYMADVGGWARGAADWHEVDISCSSIGTTYDLRLPTSAGLNWRRNAFQPLLRELWPSSASRFPATRQLDPSDATVFPATRQVDPSDATADVCFAF